MFKNVHDSESRILFHLSDAKNTLVLAVQLLKKSHISLCIIIGLIYLSWKYERVILE